MTKKRKQGCRAAGALPDPAPAAPAEAPIPPLIGPEEPSGETGTTGAGMCCEAWCAEVLGIGGLADTAPTAWGATSVKAPTAVVVTAPDATDRVRAVGIVRIWRRGVDACRDPTTAGTLGAGAAVFLAVTRAPCGDDGTAPPVGVPGGDGGVPGDDGEVLCDDIVTGGDEALVVAGEPIEP